MKTYLIYKITFPNTKVYVGLTSNSLAKRQSQHVADALHRHKRERASYLQKAIFKYRDSGLQWSILEQDIQGLEQASKQEIYWIEQYRSNDPKYGYNSTPGGVTVTKPWGKRKPKTEEQKRIISEKIKARWQDPSYRQRQKDGYNATKESTLKNLRASSSVISKKTKEAWLDPNKKLKTSMSFKKAWKSTRRRDNARKRMEDIWKRPEEKQKRSVAISNAKRHKKPTVFLITGVSGAGKSWVCNKLVNLNRNIKYIPYDKVNKADAIEMMKKSNIPILYDAPALISTFIKRNSEIFDIRVIVIMGDFLQVKKQLKDRGGTITVGLYKRWRRMKRISETYGAFIGDSTEVLKFLKTQI